MTERERLIEILLDGVTFTDQYKNTARMQAEYTADHLLRSGVIVPPCKVGDTLYFPISHRVIPYEVSKVKYDGDLLKIVTHNKLSGTQRTIWSMDVGQTIFLSREDAEKALKERKNDA